MGICCCCLEWPQTSSVSSLFPFLEGMLKLQDRARNKQHTNEHYLSHSEQTLDMLWEMINGMSVTVWAWQNVMPSMSLFSFPWDCRSFLAVTLLIAAHLTTLCYEYRPYLKFIPDQYATTEEDNKALVLIRKALWPVWKRLKRFTINSHLETVKIAVSQWSGKKSYLR